jgi:hypothetical protein
LHFQHLIKRCFADLPSGSSFPHVKSSRQMLTSPGEFFGCYDRLLAAGPAVFLGGLPAGTCSFPDQIAPELRQRPSLS